MLAHYALRLDPYSDLALVRVLSPEWEGNQSVEVWASRYYLCDDGDIVRIDGNGDCLMFTARMRNGIFDFWFPFDHECFFDLEELYGYLAFVRWYLTSQPRYVGRRFERPDDVEWLQHRLEIVSGD